MADFPRELRFERSWEGRVVEETATLHAPRRARSDPDEWRVTVEASVLQRPAHIAGADPANALECALRFAERVCREMPPR